MKTTFRISIGIIALAFVLLFTNAYYAFVAGKVVAVVPVKMNVLYSGIDNPVTITVSNTDPKNLSIKTSYGAGIALDSSVKGTVYYRIKPMPPTKQVTVTVNVLGEKGVVAETYTRDFMVQTLPDPAVFINNIKGTYWAVPENMQSVKRLECREEKSDFNCRFTIISFTMSVYKAGEWIDFVSNSQELTAEMKDALATQKSGDRVFFHDVNVKGDDSETRTLQGPDLRVR